jgi:enoyl-CoA hydratase/carnithine racemase
MSAVATEARGAVALVRMQRPQTRNALDTAMLDGLAEALDEAAADRAVRVAVLAGGDGIFASGADVRELRATSSADYLQSPRHRSWERIRRFPKPLIAAVDGYALGGGCELAFTCDLVVAGDRATFGQPEARLGIIPGAGGAQAWARTAGRCRASEIVLAGRMVSAWEAQRLGVVNRVVASERVVEAALALAGEVAALAPLATRTGKAAVLAAEEMPLRAALDHERTAVAMLLSSDDRFEGIDAFLEKRRPVFEGR